MCKIVIRAIKRDEYSGKEIYIAPTSFLACALAKASVFPFTAPLNFRQKNDAFMMWYKDFWSETRNSCQVNNRVSSNLSTYSDNGAPLRFWVRPSAKPMPSSVHRPKHTENRYDVTCYSFDKRLVWIWNLKSAAKLDDSIVSTDRLDDEWRCQRIHIWHNSSRSKYFTMRIQPLAGFLLVATTLDDAEAFYLVQVVTWLGIQDHHLFWNWPWINLHCHPPPSQICQWFKMLEILLPVFAIWTFFTSSSGSHWKGYVFEWQHTAAGCGHGQQLSCSRSSAQWTWFVDPTD